MRVALLAAYGPADLPAGTIFNLLVCGLWVDLAVAAVVVVPLAVWCAFRRVLMHHNRFIDIYESDRLMVLGLNQKVTAWHTHGRRPFAIRARCTATSASV